jgi:hypothetical protein
MLRVVEKDGAFLNGIIVSQKIDIPIFAFYLKKAPL